MCINYVNEKLHKLYISAIFEAEKKELKEEGLGDRTDDIKFESNVNDIIALIDYKDTNKAYKGVVYLDPKGVPYKPPHPSGIFTMIDDMVAKPDTPAKDIAEAFAKNYKKRLPSIYKEDMKRRF